MRIIFIRHGQTDSNVNHELDTAFPGRPLNELGLSQAEGLVERLKDEPIELVMSSDITRARQTAEPLVRSKNVPHITHPGIREIQAGDWEMDTEWRNYVGVIMAWSEDLTVSMPNGDSGESFFARYTNAINELAEEGVDCAAVVSHGAAIRIWVSAQTGTDISEPEQWLLKNTDTVVIEGEPGHWKVISWGDRAVA